MQLDENAKGIVLDVRVCRELIVDGIDEEGVGMSVIGCREPFRSPGRTCTTEKGSQRP